MPSKSTLVKATDLRLFMFIAWKLSIGWLSGLQVVIILPLYHVDGELNVSGLLTKKHDLPVKELSIGSDWQGGLD